MCLLLPLVVNGLPSVVAQEDDECSINEIEDWNRDEVVPLLNEYNNVEEDTDDIETVAELQEFRRDFDDDRVLECVFPAKLLFIRMIDLRIDAIIALNLGDDGLADDLIDDAEDARDDAEDALDELIHRDDPNGVVAQITSIADGDEVDQIVVVQGTYDPATLGDNQLWIVLVPRNNVFYPQYIIEDDCDEDSASSMVYFLGPNEWQVTANFGGEDIEEFGGQPYRAFLYLADPAEHDEMIEQMAGWCDAGSSPGISPNDFEAYGFEYIMDVEVTRR
jgi:hypothetical protein